MKQFLIAALCLGSLSLASISFAQVSYRGDVTLTGATTYANVEVPLPDGETTRISQAGFQVSLKSHLEADVKFDDAGLFLVLDPSVSVNDISELDGEIGLTELYAQYEISDFNVSAGLERLPLETARLSVPFSLSEVSGEDVSADAPKGSLAGLWGARVLWYPGDYRFRLASFYNSDDEQFGVALSAKRFFGEFELEATAVYDDNFTVGLNGSGLLGDIVVYGETWLLLSESFADGNETSVRALLGATGYLWDGAWTLEAGYFPGAGSLEAYPQLLAQWQLSEENTTWSLGGGAALQNEQVVGLLSAASNVTEGDVSTTFSLISQISGEVVSISTGFEIKGAF